MGSGFFTNSFCLNCGFSVLTRRWQTSSKQRYRNQGNNRVGKANNLILTKEYGLSGIKETNERAETKAPLKRNKMEKNPNF